ncbi:methyltransferase domain-containing protein [Geomonas sp. RF6]|uniref:class I SAM-dependent methyltransferase n=1 Tax=Geomonas sp. RF6 TaxID=2897342 RepID=UPI001E40B34B|nr:methyltransferase domain-containing protein [Geomonas sp. RF6]UFS72010.1 methyltransferase domain-containing protein [Geomonas sp. RF6]
MKMQTEEHRATIVEQFSRQAVPFAQVPGHLDSIGLLMELAEVGGSDTVLDVACGPGIVACAFAKVAAHVTGIDITPAMIEEAEKRQRQERLNNMSWEVGEAVPLPFPDNSFSLVVTRYSFHHLLHPERALAEMIRVCRPGGRVLVADVSLEARHSAPYDRLEVMRDPSHTHALTHEEFDALFRRSTLRDCRRSAYGVDIALETQLAASFPNPGDKEKLREMVTQDIGVDSFGINARYRDGAVWYTCPISVYVGRKVPIG